MSLCVGCGEILPPDKAPGRPRKWCSDRCRKVTRYSRACVDCGARCSLDGRVTDPALRCVPCADAHRKVWTGEAITAEIRRLAAELGRAPAAREARQGRGGNLPEAAAREFGSWSAALVAAGFPARRQGERIHVDAWYESKAGRTRDETAALVDRAAALYASGLTLRVCAEETGVSAATLSRYLRARGMKMRRGRPRKAVAA